MRTDEQLQLIDKAARLIIEQGCEEQGYPSEAISTFTCIVHYEDSARKNTLHAVGDALKSVARKLRQLTPPVISTFHLGPFSGYPDDLKLR